MFRIPDNNWEIITPEATKLLGEIYKEVSKDTFYPAEDNVLRFLDNDIHNVKYVILGLDPYNILHNGQIVATGRSFEVSYMNSWTDKIEQASLRNIVKTLYFNKFNVIPSMDTVRDAINNEKFSVLPPHEWFDSLESQGVLWLNSALTVKDGETKSHIKIWKPFMDFVYKRLVEKDVTFLLWGNDAKKAMEGYNVKALYAPHPRMHDFVHENIFGKVKEIEWS